jgi:hypothetical protein
MLHNEKLSLILISSAKFYGRKKVLYASVLLEICSFVFVNFNQVNYYLHLTTLV